MTTVRADPHARPPSRSSRPGLVRTFWLLAGNRFARWSAFIPTSRYQATELFRQAGVLRVRAQGDPQGPRPQPAGRHAPTSCSSPCSSSRPSPASPSTGSSGRSRAPRASAGCASSSGPQLVRLIHHLSMWAILAIALFHVYSCVLVDHIEKNGLHLEHLQRLQVPDPRGDRRVARRRRRSSWSAPNERRGRDRSWSSASATSCSATTASASTSSASSSGASERGEVVLPPGTRLVDGGTLGLELLPAASPAPRARPARRRRRPRRCAPGAVAVAPRRRPAARRRRTRARSACRRGVARPARRRPRLAGVAARRRSPWSASSRPTIDVGLDLTDGRPRPRSRPRSRRRSTSCAGSTRDAAPRRRDHVRPAARAAEAAA